MPSIILAGVEWVGGWVHTDGTACPEHLAPVERTPERGWWCTTHQMHVHMPDGHAPLTLDEMREKLTDSSNQLCRVLPDWDERGDEALEAIEGIAKRALAAVDAVLAVHPLTANVRYAVPCDAHAYTSIGARRDCPRCVKTEYNDGCQECRDEFGNPVRPGDCRAQKAILAGLSGKAADGG